MKYTRAATLVSTASVTNPSFVNDADFRFLLKAIEASAFKQGPLVVLGSKYPQLITAMSCLKQTDQQLDIVLGTKTRQETFTCPSLTLGLERVNKVCLHEISFNEYLQGMADSLSPLIAVNADFTPDELSHILVLAQERGVEAVIGLGYEAKSQWIAQLVHQYSDVETEDKLWKITFKASVIGTRSDLFTSPASKRSPYLAVKTDDSLVSIIVPAYDAREFIHEALRDVELQTHKNWELIIVEDASPQTIEDLVGEFRNRVPNNKVIFHRKPTNTGASATRNVAMQLARGPYFAFLDADDRWLPNHLCRKIDFLEQGQADIAYSSVDLYDHATGRSLSDYGPDVQERVYFPDSLFLRNFIQPSGVVMRRSVIVEVGSFDESIFLVEDYDLWLRAIRGGKSFIYDPKITTRYRKNHATASTTGRMVMCYDGIARVACRNGDLLKNDRLRKVLLSRNLITAGLAHLGHKPSIHNCCDFKQGQALLQAACDLDASLWNAQRWAQLAKIVTQSRTLPFFRKTFRRQFMKCCQSQVQLGSFRPAA
ncbi:MAG: glycosyltransferase family A protein [Pirellulaceae bacterium]|nr:glycosyltransferase family A protein [Pirellulaceae bacterium]